MTYSEKLQDPRWQKLRLEVFNRDGFNCTHCGDGESPLHVHHLGYTFGKEPWDYPISNFTTLCKPCHDDVSEIQSEVRLLMAFEPNRAAIRAVVELLKDGKFSEVVKAASEIREAPTA